MEKERQIAEKLFRQLKPEEQYPIFQLLLWLKVRDDVKQYSNGNGHLCDDFEAADAADEIVYLSIMDGANSYRENLRKGIQCRKRRRERNGHYEITARLHWVMEEQAGALYRLLLKVPETAKDAEEKLKEAKGAWKEGQFTESQLLRALCKKNLIPAELRDALLPYLIQPLAEKDLYGYLLRQKRDEDTAFVPRAVHYYLWEQEPDETKPYWDQLVEALETVKELPEKERYQMIMMPAENGQTDICICQIFSGKEDFSLPEAMMAAAREYEGTYPEFFQEFPEELCEAHGFRCAWNYRVEKVEEMLLPVAKKPNRRIKRMDAYDKITAYVYSQMEKEPNHYRKWEQINSIRNAVEQACYFDEWDTVSVASFLTAVEDYRRTYFKEEWKPFRFNSTPSLQEKRETI